MDGKREGGSPEVEGPSERQRVRKASKETGRGTVLGFEDKRDSELEMRVANGSL